MLKIDIPGYASLQLEHLVMDFNGTLAVDGLLANGVSDRFHALSHRLNLHVVTADTFSLVQQATADLPCKTHILSLQYQAEAKREYILSLGQERTAAIGNGRNDRLMLKASALGIGVVLAEGAFVQTLTVADVVCTSIASALDLLCQPMRLTATLRG